MCNAHPQRTMLTPTVTTFVLMICSPNLSYSERKRGKVSGSWKTAGDVGAKGSYHLVGTQWTITYGVLRSTMFLKTHADIVVIAQ